MTIFRNKQGLLCIIEEAFPGWRRMTRGCQYVVHAFRRKAETLHTNDISGYEPVAEL